MSAVERRPTVARNFLCGDRRSVSWTLESWMNAVPPVTRVRLLGQPANVLATALGLHDLGTLHGLAGPPFPLVLASHWAREPIHPAAFAGAASVDKPGARDVLLVVDPDLLPARQSRRVADLSDAVCRTVLWLAPGAAVPSAWRGRRPGVVVSPHQSPSMDAQLEALVEEAGAERVLVAGAGARLLGAAMAAGDIFLERLGHVPSPAEAEKLVRNHIAIVESTTLVPRGWHGARDLAAHVARITGAVLEDVAAADVPLGLVMEPSQQAVQRAA